MFKEYIEWCEREPVDAIVRISSCKGLLPGDCSAEINVDGGVVGLIGLNSTWLQLDATTVARDLHVDFRQILSLTENNPGSWCAAHDINLLITHQPNNWLSVESENEWMTEINPSGRFDAHLYGHMHEATTTSISIGGSSPRISVQAPSLFGLEKLGDGTTDRSHGYLLCEIEAIGSARSMRIWPRTARIIASRDRRIVPNQDFDLDDDNAIRIPLNSRTQSQLANTTPRLGELNAEPKSSIADELGNFRHNLYASEAHKAVRKLEQQLCADLLRKGKAVWLTTGWGLASDEFLACVQQLLPSRPNESFKIDLGSYDGFSSLNDYMDRNIVKSFAKTCEVIAKKGPILIILDNLVATENENAVALIDSLTHTIRDYCPQAYIVLRSRQLPSSSKVLKVRLRTLDEADCRAYVSLHEHGGAEYTNIASINKIFRHTDGIPSKIDSALRDIQIVGFAELRSTNSDLITGNDPSNDLSSDLQAAITELADSPDEGMRRSFDMLKYLALLPSGEQFIRIQRIEGAFGFYINQARTLADRGLVESFSADRFWSKQNEFPTRVLKVPRAVREAVKSRITKSEARAINQRLATLYFGQGWLSGELKQAPQFRFTNPTRSTAEIINANTIIIRLMAEETEDASSKSLGSVVRLTATYLAALIEGMHFRSATSFYEEIHAALPDGFGSEKAIMQTRYGKSLRMIGEHSSAKTELINARGAQPSKEAEQSLLVNLALCHEAMGELNEAKTIADQVLMINKKGHSALQAQAIKIELSEIGHSRTEKLRKHETVCRKKGAHVVANNIALVLARDRGVSSHDAQNILAGVIRSAKSEDDHYNGVRAIFDSLQLRADRAEAFSDDEKHTLIGAYHILFGERIEGLFDKCHRLLWGVFQNDRDLHNLLVLFRRSSFVWRLHGTENKEEKYLRELEVLVNPALPKWHRSLPEETAYYLTRVGAANVVEAEKIER